MLELTQTSAPGSYPVTAAEAKLHTKQDDTADDDIFTRLLDAATAVVEKDTNRQLLTATWRLQLPQFYDEILVPRPPFGTVSTFTYIDTAGTQQSLASSVYQINSIAEPARIKLDYGQSWPATRAGDYDAVQITYTCGYGAAADVPEGLKQAMLMLLGHWYENREQVVVGTISKDIEHGYQALIAPYKVGWLWDESRVA